MHMAAPVIRYRCEGEGLVVCIHMMGLQEICMNNNITSKIKFQNWVCV